ncbi:MAG: hypothetical protein LBU73_09220 [Helicobacteraceae bacterium]|jgi:hypothetical protein|nr:hypothetical protein [Helicobacteraceae bacterium]
MSRSFIAARNKYLLGTDTKMWLLFLGLTASIFAVVHATVFSVVSIQTAQINSLRDERKSYEVKIEKLIRLGEEIALDIDAADRVLARNVLLKDSLINIMELVPEHIYLTSMEATENSLRLKGYTPSLDIYNFLLKPPLESIFSKSSASFVPNENGWFAFDSLSVMDEKERLFYGDER